MTTVIVIGAGNGGLTTAAMLAQAGLDVTVLEAHSYPGGCAGTFRRKRYRFEAGATLAGGFNQGEVMDIIARRVGITDWQARHDSPAMSVHLPHLEPIPRYGDQRRWKVRADHFGDESLPFWYWQERTADMLWDFATRSPPFPPQGRTELVRLLRSGVRWLADNFSSFHPSLLSDAFVPLGYRLRGQPEPLRRFIDGQLLISAQTISRYANALFSASALDLPRRGVVHLKGGIGTIARKLEQALEYHGGSVKYKQPVNYIRERETDVVVKSSKGLELVCDLVVANITPWNLRDIIPRQNQPDVIRTLPNKPHGGWGAFMLYLGIDNDYVPDDIGLHHQVIADGPMTEGNSIFISLSPEWDDSRAPEGKRAVTISTHTELNKWWRLHRNNVTGYGKVKQYYTNKILDLARRVIPEINHAELIESGTPITFNHFTRRKFGWVGGFRQESLFNTFGPRLSERLWLVGDSVFPGQSTAAVSLGGLRVARSILCDLNT